MKRCCIIHRHMNHDCTCRCDGMVDVVDSKSTAGDSVPVRVRPPAPKYGIPQLGYPIFSCRRTRTHLNAMRTSIATEGWTEVNLYFLSQVKENANRVRPPAPNKEERLMPLFFVSLRRKHTGVWGIIQACVDAAFFNQLLMSAAFGNYTVSDGYDPVSRADCGQAVGDDQCGSALG